MLTPFELLVIFRIQVTDRDLRRRYFAVEAAMEDLAPRLGVDVDAARLAGLGVGIDAQLCRENGQRRGELARELLATDRAPEAVLSAVAACRRDPADTLAPLAAGLFAAEALVLEAWRRVHGDGASRGDGGSEGDGDGDGLDDLGGVDLVAPLRRRARIRGDADADRFFACAERLELDARVLADEVLASMRRIRSDLGL